MRVSFIRSCCLGLLVALVPVAYAQAEPGNMMKMTINVKMNIPGMGSIPAQNMTQNICTAKDPDLRSMVQQQQQQDCTVSDYKKVGNVVSYHVVCGGKSPTMTGDAKFEMRPDGGISGTVRASSNAGGQNVVMDMTYTGVRTGSCDYTPPASGS